MAIKDSDDIVRFLEPKFDFGLSVYNATLNTALGRLERMRASPERRDALAMEKGRERNRRLNQVRQSWGLTEYGLHEVANAHRNGAKRFVRKNEPGAKRTKDECILGVHVAQKIGTRVWNAVERYMFGDGGRPRFKSRRRGLHSLEGKTASANIIWLPEEKAFSWNKRRIPVVVPTTPYATEALTDPTDPSKPRKVKPSKPRKVKYCRVVRRVIRGRMRYFLQLVLEGLAPVRYVPAPREACVGIDPGPSKITFVSENGVALLCSSPRSVDHALEKKRILRQMDRSRRATNPENYEPNGVAKKGLHVWTYSKRYQKLRDALSECYRVERETRKADHGFIANIIIQLGGTVKCEKNSYVAFQKNFGKSFGRNGTASLIQRVRSKAESAGGTEFVELNAWKCRLSQYDHETGTYAKKPLNQRWTRVGDTVVQRDAYSAFLAMCVVENEHDPQLLREKWRSVETFFRRAGLARNFNQSTDFDLSKSTNEPAFAAAFSSETVHAGIIRVFGDSRSATAAKRPRRKTEVVSDEYTHRGRRKNPRLFTSGSFKAFADLF